MRCLWVVVVVVIVVVIVIISVIVVIIIVVVAAVVAVAVAVAVVVAAVVVAAVSAVASFDDADDFAAVVGSVAVAVILFACVKLCLRQSKSNVFVCCSSFCCSCDSFSFVCWFVLTMRPCMTIVYDCYEGTLGGTTNKQEAVMCWFVCLLVVHVLALFVCRCLFVCCSCVGLLVKGVVLVLLLLLMLLLLLLLLLLLFLLLLLLLLADDGSSLFRHACCYFVFCVCFSFDKHAKLRKAFDSNVVSDKWDGIDVSSCSSAANCCHCHCY